MTTVIVVLAVVAATGLLAWALTRVQQPENLTARDHDAGPSESDQLYRGDERPAGPDAEDPPTATPNRTETEPPEAAR